MSLQLRELNSKRIVIAGLQEVRVPHLVKPAPQLHVALVKEWNSSKQHHEYHRTFCGG
uniref:Uncharacterized protein n=1 Tax=Oryzias melastigma TaxID=30732 RepID=A0A3B3DV59_ORYME